MPRRRRGGSAIKAVVSDEWLVARKTNEFVGVAAGWNSFSAKHVVRYAE